MSQERLERILRERIQDALKREVSAVNVERLERLLEGVDARWS